MPDERPTHPPAELDPSITLTACRLSVCQQLYRKVRYAWTDTPYWPTRVKFDSVNGGSHLRFTVQFTTVSQVSPFGRHYSAPLFDTPWQDVAPSGGNMTVKDRLEALDTLWAAYLDFVTPWLQESFKPEIDHPEFCNGV